MNDLEEAAVRACGAPTLTVDQVAAAGLVSASCVLSWINRDGLPAIKRRPWKVNVVMLRHWLDHTTAVSHEVRARLLEHPELNQEREA
jgi:hypothetical protein